MTPPVALTLDRKIRRLAFFHGRLLDDAGDRPWRDPASGACDDGLVDVVLKDGLYALAGDPETTLTDVAVVQSRRLRVTADGARPLAVDLAAPAGAIFPVSGPDLALRRLPVAIRGEAADAKSAAPVANARVTLVSQGLPAGRVAVLLEAPLSRDLGSGSCRACALTPVAGPNDRRVVRPAPAGDSRIAVSSLQNLAPGVILRIGPAHRGQHAAIAALPGGNAVELAEALLRDAPVDCPLAAFSAGAAGAAAALVGPAFAGEGVVVIDGAPGPGLLAFDDGSGRPMLRMRDVLGDSAGNVLIEGVARLPALTLTISAPGYQAIQQSGPVEYAIRVNRRRWALAQ